MRVADELAPRMEEIRRWAMDKFLIEEVRAVGLCLNGREEVAWDPASPMNQPQFNQPWDEEAKQLLISTVQDKLDRLRSDLDVLIGRFKTYYDLDSLDLLVMAGNLGIYRGLPPGDLPPTNTHDRIGYTADYLVGKLKELVRESDWRTNHDEPQWGGNAARAFREQFLERYRTAADLQQWYALELGKTAEIFHDYVIKIGTALCQAADICIGKLGGPKGVVSEDDLSTAINQLSVGSIVFGLAAFWAPVAIPAGVISVGAGVISFVGGLAAEPVPIRYVTIEGHTVFEVLDSTYQAINAAEEVFTDGDSKLSKALGQSLTSGLAFANPSLEVPPPGVADRPGGPSFGGLKIDSAPGVPVNEDPVVVSIVDLHRAGTVYLAGAAAQYAQAAHEVWACEVTVSVTKFLPLSVARFHEARNLLYHILNRTGTALDIAADALVTIAKNYQLSDERADEVVRQVAPLRTPEPNLEPGRAGGV